ncbi:hypothetical protein EES43_15140 [Streptomyces sp. ADI96-02]|uniref:DUF6274 family protein n=1 Tax=Streptomyces sp. ADI96-02 TaxID=1522760 RepID=UPI000F55951F|nr:DUF6274 family protein [Streptomyces sp. ADI96-02]RPK61790.1 hypothetical protein EES43_15140 [Streptomyces sp. ADI96-02]
MAAPSARHETRALLRAHLAAASGDRHFTRHCPVCHRLLRLAMEPGQMEPGQAEPGQADGSPGAGAVQEPLTRRASGDAGTRDAQAPVTPSGGPYAPAGHRSRTEAPERREDAAGRPDGVRDERPATP